VSKAIRDQSLELWGNDNHVHRCPFSSANAVHPGNWRQRRDLAVWDGSLYRSDQQPDLLLNRVDIPLRSFPTQYLTPGSNGDGIGVNNGPNGKPASGKIPITTLGSTIVNFGVDPVTGILTQQDYFQPINYAKLNSGDKDISSSGVSLLDSTTFSGGGVNRVGISGSKAGVIYVVDADNLGGYKMGT
jgi:hypothetical protein